MKFPKKTISGLLLILGLFQGCKYINTQKEIKYTARFAPEGVTVEGSLFLRPNCDFLSCNGGSIYRLSDQTANEIKAEGLNFFEKLENPQIGKNGRHLGEWKYFLRPSIDRFVDPDLGLMWWNREDAQSPQAQVFGEAMNKHGYYLSSRRQEPLIVIVPQEQLVYIGWWD